MEQTDVILVDGNDNPVGQMEKMEAHYQGVLHRAFSVFLFNKKGMMLLQQRSTKKYHSGGLWTNACCSHPYPGEETEAAAHRRLVEELGIDTPITKIFDFVYKAEMPNGLTEHEFDHVFLGEFEGQLLPNPDEVDDYCYLSMSAIHESVQTRPERYTAWFLLAYPRLEKWWNERYGGKS